MSEAHAAVTLGFVSSLSPPMCFSCIDIFGITVVLDSHILKLNCCPCLTTRVYGAQNVHARVMAIYTMLGHGSKHFGCLMIPEEERSLHTLWKVSAEAYMNWNQSTYPPYAWFPPGVLRNRRRTSTLQPIKLLYLQCFTLFRVSQTWWWGGGGEN